MSTEKQLQKTVPQAIWEELRSNAPPRFDAYVLPKGVDELVPVARYLWNVLLCEALYPSLHACELTLKNAINRSLVSLYGVDWYDRPAMLEPYQMESVVKAKHDIREDDRRPVTPDRVVAKLSFGFWTSLFSDRYEDLIRDVLADGLSGVPADMKTRHRLAEHFNDIRKLRNRAFHYEPIWRLEDLIHRQKAIRESVIWIAPMSARILLRHDRFRTVYNAGWSSIRTALVEDINKQVAKRAPKN